MPDRQTNLTQANASIGNPTTGGDLDSDKYQADVVGEEAVGGTTPTPGQNDIDSLGKSLGIELEDDEELGMKQKLDRRDNQLHRLDLDNQS